MDLTSDMGSIGKKQACIGSRWGYKPAQSETGKRKEHSFCLKCDNPSRPHITLSDLESAF